MNNDVSVLPLTGSSHPAHRNIAQPHGTLLGKISPSSAGEANKVYNAPTVTVCPACDDHSPAMKWLVPLLLGSSAYAAGKFDKASLKSASPPGGVIANKFIVELAAPLNTRRDVVSREVGPGARCPSLPAIHTLCLAGSRVALSQPAQAWCQLPGRQGVQRARTLHRSLGDFGGVFSFVVAPPC